MSFVVCVAQNGESLRISLIWEVSQWPWQQSPAFQACAASEINAPVGVLYQCFSSDAAQATFPLKNQCFASVRSRISSQITIFAWWSPHLRDKFILSSPCKSIFRCLSNSTFCYGELRSRSSISQSSLSKISRYLKPRGNTANFGLMSLWYSNRDCWENHKQFAKPDSRPHVALQLAELPPYMWDDTPRGNY